MFPFSLQQHGKIGVRSFPKVQNCLVCFARFRQASLDGETAGKSEVGERKQGRCRIHGSIVDDFSKFHFRIDGRLDTQESNRANIGGD